MRNIFVVLIACILFFACDDGDVITVDLNFDQALELCDNNTDSFTIYDLRSDPSESLALILDRSADDIAPFINPTPENTTTEIPLGGTNRFLYRTYNRDISGSGNSNELCNVVTPADLIIQENYEALGGTAFVTSTIVDDDNDGIPSENEDRGEADANGNFPNAIDTDDDGVPNYLDQDDDNDNVMTINELDDENLDENGNASFLDTDNDGEFNHLDTDDDGDMILTIEEDANGDKNPRNDFFIDSNGIDTFRYLTDEANESFESPGIVLTNMFTRVVTSTILIRNFNLEIISGDEIDFGTLENTILFQQEFEEED
ncbi:MAG: hypothetical protein HKP48_07780 [Winogradskyella sp.]|nr:hypothetical protein [Winogradskyella sp.]MBT8244177.1 hypothetical protein [Winogradskyella sp.]NNK23180.1 hypothetical protein [Winogradskyella sp.]